MRILISLLIVTGLVVAGCASEQEITPDTGLSSPTSENVSSPSMDDTTPPPTLSEEPPMSEFTPAPAPVVKAEKKKAKKAVHKTKGKKGKKAKKSKKAPKPE